MRARSESETQVKFKCKRHAASWTSCLKRFKPWSESMCSVRFRFTDVLDSPIWRWKLHFSHCAIQPCNMCAITSWRRRGNDTDGNIRKQRRQYWVIWCAPLCQRRSMAANPKKHGPVTLFHERSYRMGVYRVLRKCEARVRQLSFETQLLASHCHSQSVIRLIDCLFSVDLLAPAYHSLSNSSYGSSYYYLSDKKNFPPLIRYQYR